MKIIATIGDITLTQTHPLEEDGSIWIHIGIMSAPLTKHYDEDGIPYSYLMNENGGETRYEQASIAEWDSLRDYS